MTHVEVAGERVQLEVLGWHKLWAFRGRLEFPLDHVANARRWEGKAKWFHGIRAPGTNLPGVIIAGTYHWRGEHVFYDVSDFRRALVIELKDEWFARVVVEVADPDSVLEQFNAAALAVR